MIQPDELNRVVAKAICEADGEPDRKWPEFLHHAETVLEALHETQVFPQPGDVPGPVECLRCPTPGQCMDCRYHEVQS